MSVSSPPTLLYCTYKSSSLQRIVIIANKTWEVEPITYVLTSSFFSKMSIFPDSIIIPARHGNGMVKPTIVWEISSDLVIEVWCLQKIMSVVANPHEYEQHYSSSAEKFSQIPKILQYSGVPPTLIIAFASGSYPSEFSRNGSLMIGSDCFIQHVRGDGSNPASNWRHDEMGKHLTSAISADFFDAMNLQLLTLASRSFFERRILKPPVLPGNENLVIAQKDLLALSNINMINSADYSAAYQSALPLLKKSGLVQKLGVVDTTIGIIRVCVGETPFFFIAPITDRAGYYDIEVGPKDIAQNFTACFNGAVMISWLVPFLMKYFHGQLNN